jgi:moderate conductance mechanosensitive channel
MQIFVKGIIIILLVLLTGIYSGFSGIYAQNGQTQQIEISEDKSIEKEPKEKTQLIKEPVSINGETILYIGSEGAIDAKQRTLQIQHNLGELIKKISKNNQKSITINIEHANNAYIISVEDEKIVTATQIDAKVNNVTMEKLVRTWQYNIKNLVETSLENNPALAEENPYTKIGIAFIILLIALGLLEIIRKQLITLTCFLFARTLENFNKAVNEFSKAKARPEGTDIQSPDAKNNLAEDTNKSIEPLDSPETRQRKQNESERLKEKVDIITKETQSVLSVVIRTLQVLAIIVFLNYSLYILPATRPYIAGFTHFELSVLTVIEESLSGWFFAESTWHGFGLILLIVFASIILFKVLNILSTATKNILHVFLETDAAREKRIQTLIKIAKTTLQIAIVIMAIILILSELGVNVTPIIAGASIIGLAVSFGAQNLVKDVINGIFILIENQFGIGDIIMINGTGGVVEDMTLRITVLRDISGKAHIFPNGTITQVTSFTKCWARAHLDIGIAYKEDVDTAIRIIKETADQMHSEFPEKIIAEPEVLGVNELGDSAVIIKLIMNTAPAAQWSIEREYRRRIKYAFDNAGIEIPFPHRTVYMPQQVGYATEGQRDQ